jgi:hypothetical protein
MDLTGEFESGPEAATRFASFASAFQIAERQVHITEMTAILLPVGGGAARRATSSPWRISGTVGLNLALDLSVQPPAGQSPSSYQVSCTLL